MEACQACMAGTFSAQPGISDIYQCLHCPQGTWSNHTALDSEVACTRPASLIIYIYIRMRVCVSKEYTKCYIYIYIYAWCHTQCAMQHVLYIYIYVMYVYIYIYIYLIYGAFLKVLIPPPPPPVSLTQHVGLLPSRRSKSQNSGSNPKPGI